MKIIRKRKTFGEMTASLIEIRSFTFVHSAVHGAWAWKEPEDMEGAWYIPLVHIWNMMHKRTFYNVTTKFRNPFENSAYDKVTHSDSVPVRWASSIIWNLNLTSYTWLNINHDILVYLLATRKRYTSKFSFMVVELASAWHILLVFSW